VYEKYGIDQSEIIPGVECTSCYALPIRRIENKWKCQKCSASSIKAHLKALYEYGLLIDRYITNAIRRVFRQLQSRHMTNNLSKNAFNTHKYSTRKWKIDATFKKIYKEQL